MGDLSKVASGQNYVVMWLPLVAPHRLSRSGWEHLAVKKLPGG